MTSNNITTTNAAELISVPLFQLASIEEIDQLAKKEMKLEEPPGSWEFHLSHITSDTPNNFHIKSEEILTEEEAFEKDCKELEKLIDNNPREPFGIHASISCFKYYWARQQINFFFENESERMVNYGSSSSDMRSHNLYRHSNGKKYVVHHSYGEWSDWFPLTPSEVSLYFDDETTDDEMSPKTREFVESDI